MQSRLAIHRTLGFRLSLIIAAAIFLSVMTLAVFSSAKSFEREVALKRDTLHGASTVYAARLAEAVATGDERSALLAMRGIREIQGVTHARISRPDGSSFAQIGTGAKVVGQPTAEKMSPWAIWQARQIEALTPIMYQGEQIGEFHLLADISDLGANIVQAITTLAILAIGLVVAAVAIAMRLIGRLLAPLEALTQAMIEYRENRATPANLPRSQVHETKLLSNAFADLMETLTERNKQIAQHVENLEDTIEARTRDYRLARDEAEAANAAKSDFLATMSHEIRTPMNGMLVMAEMLAAADLGPRHKRYADIIFRSGRGLLTLINDILDLSKVEAGKLDLEQPPVSLDDLIADSMALFGQRAQEKSLELVSIVGSDVPSLVQADPTRLSQILANLVNNALKFTDDGGVEIRVTAYPASAATCRLEISVTDTGIGIPADKLDNIFDAFTQADQTTTRRFGGTGLGLAICRRLIDAMGGAITARNMPDGGAQFTVSLEVPVLEGPPVLAAPPSIGVCIDQPMLAATVRDTLEAWGCELVEEGKVSPSPDLVLCTSDLAFRAFQTWPESSLVSLSEFGDAQAHGHIQSGLVKDLIESPIHRGALLNLLERATRDEWRGPEALTEPQRKPDHPRFFGLRALAVDDNAVNREVLREALTSLGVSVDFACDGAQAVEMADAEAYDIIFMDGSMPGMDGFEATRRIRASETKAKRRPTKLFALTAQLIKCSDAEWHAAGADGHIAKPFSLNRLADVLALARDGSPGSPASQLASQAPATPCDEEPLLVPETLAMMARLSASSSRNVQARIWELFETKAPEALNLLTTQIRDNALLEASSRAHALKSMAHSAGAGRLAVLCDKIEHQRLTGPSEDIIAALEACLQDTIEAMAEERASESTLTEQTG